MTRDALTAAVRSAVTVAVSLLATGTACAVCAPVEQWRWDGNLRSPGHPSTCTTPLVVQLTDDDGDGRITASDTPDVVFQHCATDCWITAVDGRTGVDHFTIREDMSRGAAHASGDIDGDGLVEIVALARSSPAGNQMLAFENDGTLKWRSEPSTFDIPCHAGIADLDQDGSPEIYCGAAVWNGDGTLRFDGSAGTGNLFGISLSAAVDLDPGRPGLELLAGRTLYDANGAVLWNIATLPDGWASVADLDGDGDPEIALAVWDGLYIIDHQGVVLDLFSPAPIGEKIGIADLDGDGRPELFGIQNEFFIALEWNPAGGFTVEWIRIPARPGNWSGSSAFDFDGDGAVEVLMRDEDVWAILDGRTGVELVSVAHPSGTGGETPIVADIDGDCVNEILVAGGCGVGNYITASECDTAMVARPMWNQISYHRTNVNDDGTIPVLELAPWIAHNTWHAQSNSRELGGPTADAGPTTTICAGETASLDASASIPCDASGLEYRWLEGASVVTGCDWSTTPICDVTPAATTRFTLEISCIGNPSACITTDDVLIIVIVEPDIAPPDIGNTLRSIRSSLNVAMSWVALANARTYNLYRGVTKGIWPPALLPGLTSTTERLPDVAGPPDLYFYRVTGSSCSGMEGP